MMDTRHIGAALKREFPKPEVNPAWVEACVAALQQAGEEANIAAVREQYLYSDLNSSTFPSGLIPANSHDRLLFPQPTLLQIISMTEIGSSAFQLHNVLEQRRDVLDGATRIRRMDDEEQDYGDGDEGGEGPVDKLPAYPRGMLKLQVSDGQQVVNAMEYKRIADLCLGETPLGAKLLVQNVKSLRNNLLLTPQNTKVLGFSVSHLEDDQPRLFLESLMVRMGKPVPSAAEVATTGQEQRSVTMRSAPPVQARAATSARPVVATSSRSEADIQRARAARAAALASAVAAATTADSEVTVAVPARVVRPVARRAGSSISASPATALRKLKAPARDEYSDIEPIEIPDSDDSGNDDDDDENVPPRSQRAASRAASRNIKHLYDETFDSMGTDDELMLLAATEEIGLTNRPPSRSRRKTSDASTRSAWFEADEEKTSSNRAATSSWQGEQRPSGRGLGRAADADRSDSPDYSIVDADDFDDSFIRQVDEVEARSFAHQPR